MTEKEWQEILEATVRATIDTHPGASPEAIADIIVGKPKRDPRKVEAGFNDLLRCVIDDLCVTDPDDDESVEETVSAAAMLDCGRGELQALAWLNMVRIARELQRRSAANDDEESQD